MDRLRPALDGVEAILFDFDGTLADSIALILESYRYATRTVLGDALPDEILLANLGRPLIDQMRILLPQRADELMRVYREHNLAHHDGMIRPYPHVREVIDELVLRGYRLGLVTSKGRALADRGLGAVGMAGLFDAVVCLEDTDEHKPHGEPVARAAQLMGVEPGRTAYVGDSPFDVMAGRAAGASTVAVTWGPFTEGELAEGSPDALISDPRELLDLFEGPIDVVVGRHGGATQGRPGRA